MPSPYKHRLVAYRAMCLLLYGKREWLATSGPSRKVRLSHFARELRCSRSRLRVQLDALVSYGLISDLAFPAPGTATLTVAVPPGLEAAK